MPPAYSDDDGRSHAYARDHPEHHPGRLHRDARGVVRPARAGRRGQLRPDGGAAQPGRTGRRIPRRRRTFEDLRSYWPEQSEDQTGITDYLNQVQKYVVSSTIDDPQWQSSTVLSGDPIEQVRALKSEPGRDIVTTGSITLCHTLIAAGLVDEYRLFTYPVVQGGGRRLFPEGFELPRLRLVDAKSFRSGITYASYAPA
ncbi:dihydrofolate reductase family protein [Solicola gregarius]|uniref:Dihydrofolate reductase family protein n=1 Tax=Solicola gregarius TaxID=2908642 RepID=A0AA46TLZ9_9ACTN|nr:dihydrofolate reductase family protein [Solicola gregarius]UYM07382.1 dihydrofolate reductase family protein [Solicola gregarius]